MDEISIRAKGYEWALREPGTIDDTDVMNAYERLVPGAKYTDDGFKAFELGVMDTLDNWVDMAILATADMARLSGVSDGYLRQEIIADRFPKPLEGTGKNRRWSIRQYEAWMDNPKRGSRSNGVKS